MLSKQTWQVVRDRKIADREAAITRAEVIVCNATEYLSEEDLEILSSDASGIVAKISDGTWTATLVMRCYVRRAIYVQRTFNPLTEILFEEALSQATILDESFASTGEIVGRLHGVPISLKDQYNIKGIDSTIGFTAESSNPALEDSLIVQIIKSEGGIPFCKTNVPQTMLSFECSNPFGTTLNPYDKERTCGGSSGGEGCLLGSDSSPFGFGSDIGGSLRIPAHFSGCFALKPCIGRFPAKGIKSPNNGFDAIKSTLGPMGRSVGDLELSTRIMVEASASVKLSRTLPLLALPYREITLPEKLKFGYYFTDGFCKSSPACCRAISETISVLEKQGHECILLDVNSSASVLNRKSDSIRSRRRFRKKLTNFPSAFIKIALRALEIFVALTSAGGYETLLSGLKGDPQESSLWLTTLGVRLPSLVRNAASAAIHSIVGDPAFASIMSLSRVKSVTETQQWQYERDTFVNKFREFVWGELNLDAIICAPQATPALKIGATWNLSALAISTILYNLVDSTVGLIPVTFVDEKLDGVSDEWKLKTGEGGSKLFEERVYGLKGVYNPKEMHGLPVGIQLVGAVHEEEKVLAMMKLVDAALGARGFSPGDFVKREQKNLRESKK